MTEVRQFNKFEDYVDFNRDFVEKNPMLYYFLILTIKRVLKGEVLLYKFFNVINDLNYRLIALLIEDFCLVYGDNFDQEMISTFSDYLEFKKFKRYEFAGNKNVIDALFKLNDASYELQKHRIIYKCAKISELFTHAPGKIEMGNISRLDELVPLGIGFTKDYYGENKNYSKISEIMVSGIINDSLYQWVHDGKICSIAQSMNDDYDFPVVGHFYTDPQYRNKGYGSSLIYELTKGLLGVGHEFVMLSTNALTPASNKVFAKVGYSNTGEYIMGYKSK